MSPNTYDADGRFPTAGPDSETYERYRCKRTEDGGVCIYDSETGHGDRWIRASEAISLAEYR